MPSNGKEEFRVGEAPRKTGSCGLRGRLLPKVAHGSTETCWDGEKLKMGASARIVDEICDTCGQRARGAAAGSEGGLQPKYQMGGRDDEKGG